MGDGTNWTFLKAIEPGNALCVFVQSVGRKRTWADTFDVAIPGFSRGHWYQTRWKTKDGGWKSPKVQWLVGGLVAIFFLHILGIVIPTDFHIFQRGSNHQPVMFPARNLSFSWGRPIAVDYWKLNFFDSSGLPWTNYPVFVVLGWYVCLHFDKQLSGKMLINISYRWMDMEHLGYMM